MLWSWAPTDPQLGKSKSDKDQTTQPPAPDSDIPRVQAVAALVVHGWR